MTHNIFAWTEPTPPDGYPAYVSINRDEQGRHTITVRSRGNGGRDVVTVEMPVESFETMLTDIAADLYRDERPNAEVTGLGRNRSNDD